MKIVEVYKGFEVISSVRSRECASRIIHLVHKKSGLEVLHLLNKDEENLFSFNFRTPPVDSTGVAHIIEHTVLCGSKKYPVKDPFLILSKQSVSTFLNAMTGCDRTMFPASSVIKADYFNLMGVYADAVFFPLLKREAFMQEGTRLELDEKGKPSLQGVVFNEMKGVYSSQDSVTSRIIQKSLLYNTPYGFDSGGSPDEIPNLTYEKFKAFYKKHYCTNNCLVFLYGNIPTKEQLDFLDENIIKKVRSFGKKVSVPKAPASFNVKPFVKDVCPLQGASEKKNVEASTVNLNFLIPFNTDKNPDDFLYMTAESVFMSELLFGPDCAPVSKVLIESKLGTDVSNATGVNTHLKYPFFSAGLIGAKESDALKIKELVLSAFRSVCEKGISTEDYKRVVLEFEFSNREEVRFSGPYALTYLSRAVRAWTYDAELTSSMSFNDAFLKLKKKMDKNPSEYVCSYIKKVFLENKNTSLVVVTPSKKFAENRRIIETKNAAKLFKASSKKQIQELLLKMYEFQNAENDESVIPRVKISDLKTSFEENTLARKKMSGIDVFEAQDDFHSMAYVKTAFTFDMLSPSDYFYIPLLSECLSSSGWKGTDWSRAQNLVEMNMGFYAETSFSIFNPESKVNPEKNPVFDRDILFLNIKTTVENIKDALDVASKIITLCDFTDEERIRTILTSVYENMKLSFSDNAASFAKSRSLKNVSCHRAKCEMQEGLSQLLFLKKLMSYPIKKVCSDLRRIFTAMKNGGAFVFIAASSEDLKKVKKELPVFIKNASLKPLIKKPSFDKKAFFRLTEINGIRNKIKAPLYDEVIVSDSTVGYGVTLIRGKGGSSKESFACKVLCHLLSNSALWEKLRMRGGSYGVYLMHGKLTSTEIFLTYRDPSPFESVKTFNSFVKEIKLSDFSSEEVEKAVTGVYSSFSEPVTPLSRVKNILMNYIYGYPAGLKSVEAGRLLKVNSKLIKEQAAFLSESEKCGESVVFASERILSPLIKKTCGKIVKLEL